MAVGRVRSRGSLVPVRSNFGAEALAKSVLDQKTEPIMIILKPWTSSKLGRARKATYTSLVISSESFSTSDFSARTELKDSPPTEDAKHHGFAIFFHVGDCVPQDNQGCLVRATSTIKSTLSGSNLPKKTESVTKRTFLTLASREVDMYVPT